MNRLLAKVASEDEAQDRLKILQKEFSNFEFEVKDPTPGEMRHEIIIKDVRTGTDVLESDVETMKRIAQGIYVPQDKSKSQATKEVTKNITTGSQAIGKQTAPAAPTK